MFFCMKNFLLAMGDTLQGPSIVKYPALSHLGASSVLEMSTLLLITSSALLLMSILLLLLLVKPPTTSMLADVLLDDIYRFGDRALNESDSSRL